MRVLVTRPAEDAGETAAALRQRGHAAVLAPLLGVTYHDGPPLHLDGVQALLATSVNGVRAFARRSTRRNISLFAVGAQTSEAARAIGFADVRNADGNSHDLAAAVQGWVSPGGGALLHIAGAEAEGRLAERLRAAGYTVRTEVLYDVPVVSALPAEARNALQHGLVDGALFFSARSARVFADCVAVAGLDAACGGLIAVCISEAAARPLSGLAFRAVRIAGRPNQASLLDCLG